MIIIIINRYVQVSGPDSKLYINAITTLVFFVLSLALVIRPSMRSTDFWGQNFILIVFFIMSLVSLFFVVEKVMMSKPISQNSTLPSNVKFNGTKINREIEGLFFRSTTTLAQS